MLDWLRAILVAMPPFIDGVIGGTIAAIVIAFIESRWKIVRRNHNDDDDGR